MLEGSNALMLTVCVSVCVVVVFTLGTVNSLPFDGESINERTLEKCWINVWSGKTCCVVGRKTKVSDSVLRNKLG